MEKLALVNIGKELLLKPGVGVESIGTLGEFITAVLPNIYILAGLILLFLLIGGGLMVIVSAGQENPEGAATGKKAITAAVAGFFVIFASYWIIQIIEVVAGIEIFAPGF